MTLLDDFDFHLLSRSVDSSYRSDSYGSEGVRAPWLQYKYTTSDCHHISVHYTWQPWGKGSLVAIRKFRFAYSMPERGWTVVTFHGDRKGYKFEIKKRNNNQLE